MNVANCKTKLMLAIHFRELTIVKVDVKNTYSNHKIKTKKIKVYLTVFFTCKTSVDGTVFETLFFSHSINI